MRKCYLVILTVLLLACQREETPRSPILVVEGWIESGGAPMVLLSESVPVLGATAPGRKSSRAWPIRTISRRTYIHRAR